MRCKSHEFFDGGFYHIYNRSVAGLLLFKNDSDYLYYLGKLKKNIPKYDLSILAYCLMPTHFHFFIKQEGDRKLFQLFESVNISYVLHYNHKYHREGALLGGPLQHVLVDDEKYFFHVCSYIHLNPVSAGIVNNITSWPFSNFLEWAGLRNGTLFNQKLANLLFGNISDYSSFVFERQEAVTDKKLRTYLIDE